MEAYTHEIPLPNPSGTPFYIVDYGEHHMGCSTIEFRLPFDLDGVRRFFTTNGEAFLSRNGRYLYLQDSLVLLRVDLAAEEVEFYRPTEARYIDDVNETQWGFNLKLSDRTSTGKKVEGHYYARDMGFSKGTGPVKEHLFPSAYKPVVESILNDPDPRP